MIARLALFAALAGSATGAAVVLADEPDPAPAVPVVQAASTPTPTPRNQLVKRDVRIIAQVPEPGGGAPWALRRFTAKVPRSKVPRVCFGIGRLSGDRFGWIDASGAFRPQPEGQGGCYTAKLLRQRGALVNRFTTVAFPPGGAPQPRTTVTWGLAAPAVRAVHPEGDQPLSPGADGAILRAVAGEVGGAWFSGAVEFADGRRKNFNPFPLPPGYKGETAIAGTDEVAVRAPDPGGGEPWALIASRGTRGGVCLAGPDRLVGTRLGRVDRHYGVFYADPLGALARCPRAERRPTRAYPMRITTGIWGSGFDDPRGRIERRVESTRVVFSGFVHADVQTVTIRTPRDVRTLVPSSDAHAVLAVYDGRFPGGEVTATARMKDGREVTRSLYVE